MRRSLLDYPFFAPYDEFTEVSATKIKLRYTVLYAALAA